LQKLVKNYTLLSIVEAAKGANALTPKMAVPRGLGNTPKSDPGRSSLEEEIKGEDDPKASKLAQSMPPPSLSYNQQCPKHGLLIHSYLREDN
jgi:hypothetical protein